MQPSRPSSMGTYDFQEANLKAYGGRTKLDIENALTR